MTPWGCMPGLLSVQQQFEEEVPTPGRGPRRQHPTMEKHTLAARRKQVEASMRPPPGPKATAPVAKRRLMNTSRFIVVPVLKKEC